MVFNGCLSCVCTKFPVWTVVIMEIILSSILLKALIKGSKNLCNNGDVNKTEISHLRSFSSVKYHNSADTPVEKLSLYTTVINYCY